MPPFENEKSRIFESKLKGKHLVILASTDDEEDIEGSLSSGKTILLLWRELKAIHANRGMWNYIGRWTDEATKTLLRPVYEQLMRIAAFEGAWNNAEHYYQFENGSRTFAFGLKTQSQLPEERYGKIRGLAVSRMLIDQAEQLPEDIAKELRARLRPDIEAQVAGQKFKTKLTFIANPVPKEHWLAKEFPEDNHIAGRKYYSLGLSDNRHNLPDSQVEGMLRSFPPNHPKHRTMIQGLRGREPRGVPVYSTAFDRDRHLAKTDYNPDVPLLEVLDAGKANPCVLWSQYDQWGRWIWLGGIMGISIDLGEFCEIMATQRVMWFGSPTRLLQASNPFGMRETTPVHLTAIDVLHQHKIFPRYIPNANQPIILRAAIERIADTMKRHTVKGEAFQCDPDRWLLIDQKETREDAFGPEGLDTGYVWSKVLRRTANKQITVPVEDGWFEHPMRCAEMTELNFGRGNVTQAQIERQAAKAKQRELREQQFDRAEPFRWNQAHAKRRAGY
jgi:hypothetical protein